jgi:hypothetical protein
MHDCDGGDNHGVDSDDKDDQADGDDDVDVDDSIDSICCSGDCLMYCWLATGNLPTLNGKKNKEKQREHQHVSSTLSLLLQPPQNNNASSSSASQYSFMKGADAKSSSSSSSGRSPHSSISPGRGKGSESTDIPKVMYDIMLCIGCDCNESNFAKCIHHYHYIIPLEFLFLGRMLCW